MKRYTIRTNKTWNQTLQELRVEFDLWEVPVNDWETNYPKGARFEGYRQSEEDRLVTLTYKKNGKPVFLRYNEQQRAVDNLRAIFLAIHDMRMIEVRGVSDLVKQAYMQIEAPAGTRPSHEVLGIMPDSPVEVARAVYKALAAKYHPDNKATGNAEKFKEVKEAFERYEKQQ